MPLYDFKCADCNARFEELVRGDETPRCPACQSVRTQRLQSFSAAVSTTSSREKALAGARRQASSVKREQDHAHQEYVRKHMEDH